ncbi:MAG: response regulator [Candidatus Omnitrophica bacterium]|nr:response regulator [Candidatus Omnitrophota bacterium]
MAKRILIIDDDRLVAESLSKLLKRQGYEVSIAYSGLEAINNITKITKLDFDLIISDIKMPDMDGMKTLKRIRESSLRHNKDKVPAIIITGYAGEDEIYRKAGELGIVECIYKPFELDEFIEVIRRNLELPPKYKRTYPRIEIGFPVEVVLNDPFTGVVKKISGKTVDLSENGIGLILDSLLPPKSIVDINVNSSPHYTPFQLQASIIWAKPVFKDGYYRCGLHFLKIEEPHLTILREIFSDYKLLDNEFISITKEMRGFIQDIKADFDEFDRLNNDEKKRIEFIWTAKGEIFPKLDNYFAKVWEFVKGFERDRYAVHQNYYQQVLGDLLLEPIQINRHVYQKPLGYPGDYIMMNYIYDYNGNKNYLGTSSFEKLINHYTCNIPISCSNIKRKEFLKEKILEALETKDKAKILSVACGPARELIELLREGKITKPLLFKCLDFEKKALDYVDNEIKKIEQRKKELLSIEYICRDITSIIRDRQLKEKLRVQDLIYAFGIFDYLSDYMAARLTKELFQLLDKDGKLIICNVSLKNSSHRAYYELLGGWNMVYRTKEDMLSWTNSLSDFSEIKFEELSNFSNYLFLSISKTK